jgi:hypothetical protein
MLLLSVLGLASIDCDLHLRSPWRVDTTHLRPRCPSRVDTLQQLTEKVIEKEDTSGRTVNLHLLKNLLSNESLGVSRKTMSYACHKSVLLATVLSVSRTIYVLPVPISAAAVNSDHYDSHYLLLSKARENVPSMNRVSCQKSIHRSCRLSYKAYCSLLLGYSVQ